MAYQNYLYSASEENVANLAEATSFDGVNPSNSAVCSHVLASWVELMPLGEVLNEVLDGGELISPHLHHPFMPPRFHHAATVKNLHQQLESAWQAAIEANPISADDWYAEQIGRVRTILAWASERDEAIVSALEPQHRFQPSKTKVTVVEPRQPIRRNFLESLRRFLK